MAANEWRIESFTRLDRALLIEHDEFPHHDKTRQPIMPETIKAESVCSKCPGFAYITSDEFREHCKSEWHLDNLKRGKGLSFDEWAHGDQSGSDSSSCSEEDETIPNAKLLINSIPFTPLAASRIAIPSIYSSLSILLDAKYFVVVLLRSGRFAGAVWDNTGNVIAHTSFKRYTVRRKNGGSQSKNDNAKGSPANSVGAQIRRAQEKKLSEDVYVVISDKWGHFLMNPGTVVFAYASKQQVNDLFVGPLEKSRAVCNVLKVPLSVGPPTYAEVCRVYKQLTSVAIQI